MRTLIIALVYGVFCVAIGYQAAANTAAKLVKYSDEMNSLNNMLRATRETLQETLAERDLARSDADNASKTIDWMTRSIRNGTARVLTMEEAKAEGIPGPPGDPNYESLEPRGNVASKPWAVPQRGATIGESLIRERPFGIPNEEEWIKELERIGQEGTSEWPR